uniref:Uncharacterized protein n=1 Tax=Magallana gigas TaxID=29159 RepID=A0A8W8HP07_MAGGI
MGRTCFISRVKPDDTSGSGNSQEHCVRSVLVQKTKMSTRKLVSVSVTRNGVTTKIPCTQEVADMLMSKEIDSKVKEIIVNELMLSPSTPPSTGETSMLPSPSTPPLPGPSTPSLPGPSKPSLPGPQTPSLPGPSAQDEDTTSDEDYEDFDVFEKIPDMKPKAVLESGTGTSKKRPAADDSSSEETEPLPVKKRVHPKRSAEILQVMLKDLMEKREEKAEQRHQEKLATANSLIEVLKELAKKLNFTGSII